MSKVNLTDKQKEYWREANRRWNFKVGATRSGKTYVDYFVIPKRIMERKGESGLAVVLGNTRETIRRNIIIPMQDIFGSRRVGNIRSDNSCFMFGERVFCLGADNANHVDRIRGSSIKYCYGDEVATWHPEVFEMLKSRLDKGCSCFDGALNPQSPSHWLKEFLESDADIYSQHYTIFDNPYLPKDFVDNLCKEYEGTVYYNRYILGEWALAEGLIYPMLDDAIIDTLPPGVPQDWCVSVDYGTMNAFAAILWGRWKDTWYAVDEYYYSGRDTGKQKTDEEYARDLREFIAPAREWERYQKQRGTIWGDYGVEVIIDPSAASFIALLQRDNVIRVRKADNDVLDGIRLTARALSSGKIKISKELENWKMEAQGYVWDEKAAEDTPVKYNDHLMDATRYFVKTKRIAEDREIYTPLWN